MIVTTASKLQLAMTCQASVVLPKVASIAGKPPGPQAQRGTKFHKAIEHGLMYQRRFGVSPHEAGAEALNKAMELEVGDDFSKIPSWLAPDVSTFDFVELEIQYALYGDTSAKLNGKDRSYDPCNTRSTCIVGTADAVLTRETPEGVNMVEIWDWKTGGNVARAKDNWQLLFFAVCKYLRTGITSISGHIWYVDQGRVDSYSYTEEELLSAAEELKAIMALSDARMMVDPTPGEHCRRCPSRPLCPAHSEHTPDEPKTLGEYVDQAFVLGQRAVDMEEELRAQLQVSGAPPSILGSNGLSYGKWEVRKEKINGERAQTVLAGIPFITSEQRNILGQTKMSKSSIEKLLGVDGAKRLLDTFRERGALDVTSEERYGFRNKDE